MPYKYCKAEHNVAESCTTLKLGTFEEYRLTDPSFTIADAEEGFVYVRTELGDSFDIPFEQWNSVFGEAVGYSPTGSMVFGANRKLPGTASWRGVGGEFEIDPSRQALRFNANIDFLLYHPNSYMFCMSLDDEAGPRPPSDISEDYDSYYKVPELKLLPFAQHVSELIRGSVKLEDLRGIEKTGNVPFSKFRAQLICGSRIEPVVYVVEKGIRLRDEEQLKKAVLEEMYFESLFRKDNSFSGDRELRIVFPIYHPVLGHLPVRSNPPLILDFQSRLDFVEPPVICDVRR